MVMERDRNKLAVVILAAGMGTRMKSSRAKVLHEINGRPMILFVVETAKQIAPNNVILVVGNQAEKVEAVVTKEAQVAFVLQTRQLGTGHAVRCAMSEIAPEIKEVLILYGDVPLLKPQTIQMLIEAHGSDSNDVTVLAVEMDDPTGYGRILCDDQGRFCGIVEQADADDKQKKIKLINTGIYCVKRAFLEKTLDQIKADNKQAEYYLTDIVALGYAQGHRIGFVKGGDSAETTGINTLKDLAQVERIVTGAKGNRT